MSIRKTAALALTTLALVAASLAGAGAAEAQVTNPCDRLNAGQVKYPSYGANRITFATADTRNSNTVTITSCVRTGGGYAQEWQDWGYAGLNGFAPPGLTWEDSYRSPTGSYSVTEAFGRANPGTSLAYHTLNPNSRWGGEHNANYNQYFEGAGGENDENMWYFMNNGGYYEQGAVINYNRQPDMPVTMGASFAIFFHAGRTTSAGCLSTSLDVVNRFLRSAQAGDRIIMGADDDVFTPYTSNIWGTISSKYFSTGGQLGGLGSPTSSETGGLRAGGAYQNYQGGSILWSPNTGTHVSGGAIRQKWAQTGFENGGLGYPTSDETGGLRAGGTYQSYENGAILWSPNTGAHLSVGGIRQEWAKTGFESGGMGYPTTDEIGGLRNGGTYQNYENGAIVWSPATGAHLTIGAIRTVWGWSGFENGGLGYPTSDEYAIGGGVAQDYQGGTITATQAGGVQVIAGAIGVKYQANRAMGYATSPSVRLPDGGYYQNFQNGAILWTAATGAHLSVGGTRQAWQNTGFERGTLGYPTSDEIPVQGGVYQSYQGGVIYWSPTTAGHAILSDYNVKLAAVGGLATLGFPTSDKVAGLKDGGAYQNFQNGALISSTATGIHTSTGATRAAWAKTGYETGTLGYPTTDEYANPNGGVAQDFQGGRILVAADGTVQVVLNAPAPTASPTPAATASPAPTATGTPSP